MLLLRHEWCLLVKRVLETFIGDKVHGTSHIVHLFVGRIVTNDRSKSTVEVFMSSIVVLQGELSTFSVRYIIKEGLHSQVMLAFIIPFNIFEGKETNIAQVMHQFWDDLLF